MQFALYLNLAVKGVQIFIWEIPLIHVLHLCFFCVQDSVEALLFLRRWRVHRGRFSQAARPLHLGEEHWQPGEDPAWDQRRAAAGCGCKDARDF